ncbi:MAG: hypothetical protein ACRECX_08070 [Methyloceanibacter sp.]|uniref:hypothetical protein n=1 Tax=Methyloceanibacter sp. TaxID=1965321 RepID=UPI003D6CC257
MERTDASDPLRPADGHGEQAPAQTEPSAPPDHFRFSTRDIPAGGKFETWRDLWMRRIVEVDVTTDSPESFEGEIELWRAGPLSVASMIVKEPSPAHRPCHAARAVAARF